METCRTWSHLLWTPVINWRSHPTLRSLRVIAKTMEAQASRKRKKTIPKQVQQLHPPIKQSWHRPPNRLSLIKAQSSWVRITSKRSRRWARLGSRSTQVKKLRRIGVSSSLRSLTKEDARLGVWHRQRSRGSRRLRKHCCRRKLKLSNEPPCKMKPNLIMKKANLRCSRTQRTLFSPSR